MARESTTPLLAALAATALLPPGPAAGAARHVGPVTGLAEVGGHVYACSQAGLLVEIPPRGDVPGRALLLARPDFRPVALAVHGDHLLVAGGRPAESGQIARLPALGTTPDDLARAKFEAVALAGTKVADDLVYALAVHPSGKRVALGCADGRVITLDLPGLVVPSLRLRHRHGAAARSLAYSSDGRWLASAGLDGAIILSPATANAAGADERGEGIHPAPIPLVIQDHTAPVECVVFSPDSTLLASGSRDSKIRLHDLTGRLRRTYNGIGTEDLPPLRPGHPPRLLALAWRAARGGDNPLLLAGTSTGDLYRLSMGDDGRRRLRQLGTDNAITAILLTGGGGAVVGTPGAIVWIGDP